jgi:lysozyme family protein
VQHPFAALEPEYVRLLSQMQITQQTAVQTTAARLLRNVAAGRYAEVTARTGIPQIYIATSFEREASSDFTKNPAQGWSLRSRSQVIPYNGPFATWLDAALAAYAIDGVDKVPSAEWTWPRLAFEEEAINGFGYRAHGVHSPYLWAGTNDYSRGKFIADGRFSADAVDQQLGTIPVARAMVLADPALDLPGWPSTASDSPKVPPMAPPVGVGGPVDGNTTTALQLALNKFTNAGLQADGNYGRRTRNAVRAFEAKYSLVLDGGYAGPEVWAQIAALEAGK